MPTTTLCLTIAVFLLLLGKQSTAQSSPTWQRNPNIDAGQSKPINFGVSPADAKSPGFTFNYNQHFNKTDFVPAPRVMLAQLVFAFPTTSADNTSLMGYNITMGTINNRNFTFQVETTGITIYGLHFIYIAVSPIYDGIYHMQAQYLQFGASEAVRDTGQGTVREQTVTMINPQSCTTNSVGASQVVLQVWILGYTFSPNGFLNVNISSVEISTTEYNLTVIVDNDLSLQSLAVTAIMVNRTVLLEYSYTQYLDLFATPLTGNQDIVATSDTITDFVTQYFFRNTLFGAIGNDIPIGSFLLFYYNVSSVTGSTTPSIGMNERSRVCSVAEPYYFYQNQTCISACPDYYFTNTTFDFCIACHYSCQNCSNQADSQACIQCEAAMLRNLANSSCDCQDGFFDNGTVLCANCDSTCLTCSDGTASGCLSCNATLNRILVGSICVLDSGTCGDGLLASGEECDDGNTANSDGCSSACLVEPNHSCTNNVSVIPVSNCFYSSPLQLSLSYVYKVPLQNKIEVSVSVQADNVNEQQLQNYVQSTTSVSISSAGRLLSVSNVVGTSSSYDSASKTMTVSFAYTADVTLPTLAVSVSSTSAIPYFANIPSTTATLSTPDNRLMTTFLAEGEVIQLQIMGYFFLALIVLSWLLVILGVIFGQTALGIEWMLVLTICYQCLLQSQFIYEGYAGLVIFGKYTYGYNVDFIATNNDRMTILGLKIALANTLNITAGLALFAVLVILAVFLYEAIQYKTATHTDKEVAALDQASTAQITSARLAEVNQPVKFKVKKGAITLCLEVAMALVLLTAKIAATSFTLSLINGKQILSSVVPLLAMLISSVIVFIFYLAGYNLDYLQDLSFRRILRSEREEESAALGNCLVKYHYFILYVVFLLFGIINGAVDLGIAVYIAIIIGVLVWGTMIAINKHYFRKQHTVRSVINCITVILAMSVLALQGTSLIPQTQTIAPSAIVLAFFYISFGVSSVVFVKIEYRRRRKRNKKTEKKNQIANISVMQPQNRANVTQEPLPFELAFQDLPPEPQQRFQNLDGIPADLSHVAFKSKDSQPSESSPPQTHKKPRLEQEERQAGPTEQRKWNLQRQVDPFSKTRPLHSPDFQNLDC